MISTTENLAGVAKKTRVKNEVAPVKDRAMAEEVLLELAATINAKIALNASMDARLLEIKGEYQAELAEGELRITNLLARLEQYASTHPEIFPKDRKSVVWPAGKFGWRTDPPSLALLKRSFGWAQILAVIVSKRLRKFVRTKIEVDKDAILARCGTLEKPTRFQTRTLPALGLKLNQEEKFFVEPDLTRTEVKV